MSAADTAAALYDAALFCGFSLALCCGRGFLLALLRPRRGAAQWLFETLYFLLWGALAFLFILGKTQTRQPRSYMAAGAVLGAAGYLCCFARPVRALGSIMRRAAARLTLPFRKAQKFLLRVLGARLKAVRGIVYNTLHGSKRSKTEQPPFHGTDAPPRRAYAQTQSGAHGA